MNETMPGMKPDLRRTRRQRKPTDGLPNADRLPPHSIEAEQGVLGCLLLSPADGLGTVMEKTGGRTELFYDPRHQLIFNLLKELHEKNRGIDLITVSEELRQRQVLDEVGGIGYLSQLPDMVPSAANLMYYLDIVVGKYRLRRLLAICAPVQNLVHEHTGEVEDLLLSVEAAISSLTEEETRVGEEHIKTVMVRVLNDLEENRYIRGKTQLRGLPTGPDGNYLDKLIRGIRETFYMVIAGRPGEGKTSKAMNIVEYLATEYVWWQKTGRMVVPEATLENPQPEPYPEMVEKRGIPVAVFSIEMDGDSLVSRLLFGRAGVDTAEFMQGFAEKEADFAAKLQKASVELSRANIYIDASPAQTMGQIAAKARRMVKQYGIKLFVLDYLQLVEGDDDGRKTDRVKELNMISRKIMSLKKQLKVPWLVLCQMNRNIETSEAKRDPVLSDLKDSGAIEQDADLVMFAFKPSRQALAAVPDGGRSEKDILDSVCAELKLPWSQRPYRINMLVAKNRFGPTGKAEELFQKNLCRFEDWHMWKVKHGVEDRNAGESKALGGGDEAADLAAWKAQQG